MYRKHFKKCNTTNSYVRCIKISIPVNAPAHLLFESITDISCLPIFFPKFQFETIGEKKTLQKVGDTYRVKSDRSKKWTTYKIVVIEKDRRVSGKIVSSHPIFAAFKYDHQLITSKKEKTISEETVEYTPRYGVIGKIMDFVFISRIVKHQLFKAHNKLKVYCENI